jgi:GTP pyrophosphokinase
MPISNQPPTAGALKQAIEQWLARLRGTCSPEQVERLAHAHELARHKQAAPSLAHARAVVEILAVLHLDVDTLVAGFICSLEDDAFSPETVQSEFGDNVAGLVAGVRKMRIVDEYQRQVQGGAVDAQHLEGLRKLLLGMAEDIRVVLIKLAERVQIMRELKTRPEAERRRVAQETKDIFGPLANRLGVWQYKWELEDLSFRFLEPETYQRVAKLLDERRVDRERYINTVIDELRRALAEAGIEGEVTGRPKHIYSIWRKMQGKDMDFHQLFDVRATRILVDTVAECYAALGIVHTLWHPVHGEFDDYIASPKENMYQSLHTAVVGPEGKTLEIQIRTRDMHRHSEYGVAAHWGYKEGGQQEAGYREKIAWLRQILEWKDEERNAGDFIDRFKSEVFQDRVYVLTPKGQVVDLPRGATPLDFAYHIHTSVGNRFRGAKVDGKIVPINYALQNGQQVEILTSKLEKPSRDWLNPHLGYLKSSRAQAKVRSWFRQQDYAQNVGDGRELLERELHRLSVSGINFELLAKRFQFETLDDFFAALGCGDVSGAQIASAVNEQVLPAAHEPVPLVHKPRVHEEGGGDVQVMGVGDLMTHMARCCKPLPDDAIVGYVTRGRGVTIHRRDCPNLIRLQSTERERLLSVEWQRATAGFYAVDIYVRAYDRQGLLRDITEVLSNNRLNVTAVNTLTNRKTQIADMTLSLEVNDVGQLSSALAKIEQLPNVMEARRKLG